MIDFLLRGFLYLSFIKNQMKNILTIAGITIIMISCNAGKKEEEAKTNKDTAIVAVPDTANQQLQKNTTSSDADLVAVGDISLGLTQSKLIELLGQPDSKGKSEEWGADGLVHQDWVYKAKGITLNMDQNINLADQTIFSIRITKPCNFKTKRNIGIGSTYKEVMAAYEKEIDKTATDTVTITVGSLYGGIIFNFNKGNKVETVFIGAAAE
jgi:hypothetical protein